MGEFSDFEILCCVGSYVVAEYYFVDFHYFTFYWHNIILGNEFRPVRLNKGKIVWI